MSGLRMVDADYAAPAVNAMAVEMVERLLWRCRTGQVAAVALVEVRPNGTVSTGWSEVADKFHQLNSGATALVARLNQEE